MKSKSELKSFIDSIDILLETTKANRLTLEAEALNCKQVESLMRALSSGVEDAGEVTLFDDLCTQEYTSITAGINSYEMVRC